MDFAHYWFGGGGDNPIPFPIGESLRFRGGQYLSRTPASAGNRRTFTYSCWWKQGRLSQQTYLFSAGSSFANYDILKLSGDQGTYKNNLEITNPPGSAYYRTNAKYRDVSGWYHFVMVVDTPNATGGDRVRTYVNGERVTSWQSTFTPSQNDQYPYWNNTVLHQIGLRAHSSSSYPDQWNDGYMAEIHFVDGAALDPTAFGQPNADGVWVPIRVTGLNYGTNGFHLDFSDPSNIGADRSGNGNNWTPAGFELANTSSINYDWMADSPTTNTATWSSIFRSNTSPTYSNANQSVSGATTSVEGTHGVSEGKWYFECIMTGGGSQIVGICGPTLSNYSGNLYDQSTAYVYQFQGNKGHNGSLSSYGASYGNNDVIGIAFDADAGSITFYKNGTSQGVAFTGISGTFLPAVSNNGNAATHNINAGQRPFRHNPPAGYEPWKTAAMADVPIANPRDHFRVITDTGANILSAAQAAFPSGLWWIKDLANSNQHQLVDSVRGSNLRITTPSETTEAAYSAPSGNSTAFCWNLVDDRSNGFDIVLYSGNSSNRTVAHNLGVQPEFLMVCNRNRGSASHRIWTPFYTASSTLEINSGRSATTENTIFNNTAPTDSVFSLGNSSMNQTGINYVAYLWRSVPGFSHIGRWTANGIRDGVFCWCGFRPSFIMYKPINTSGNWGIRTTAMSPHNPSKEYFYANGANGQYNAALELDILSNGFKFREDGGQSNSSGQNCLFMAFAEHPFGGGNVAPSPAR